MVLKGTTGTFKDPNQIYIKCDSEAQQKVLVVGKKMDHSTHCSLLSKG